MPRPTDDRSPFTMGLSLMGEAPDWPTPKAIRIVRPGQREFVVPLLTEREYQLGRAETVELYFGDETVSRIHGFLHFDAPHGGWVYRDAGSTFGSALVDPTGIGPSEPIPPRKGTVVLSGHIVALGEGGSRIEFLENVPPDALSSAGAAEWKSPAARELEARIRVASNHALPLVLLGPSGSGKTYVANRIHQLSGRRGHFVSINCAQLPTDPTALRSELLGHEKGAFTSAVEARVGQLLLADGGTLFLDEVELLDPDAQAFLLTVLDGADELVALGAPASSAQPRPDFRLISATKQRLDESPLRHDLARKLGAGDFIQVPGLKERPEDVPLLALRFLEELTAEQQVDCELSPDALAFLAEQKWPGEIRELRAMVRTTAVRNWWRANSASTSTRRRVVIGVQELRSYQVERKQVFGAPLDASPPTSNPRAPGHASPQSRKRPADLTREDLEVALRLAGGNKTRAAHALGISYTTLRKKLEELGL